MSQKVERKIRQASKRVAVPAMIEAYRAVNRLPLSGRIKFAWNAIWGRIGE